MEVVFFAHVRSVMKRVYFQTDLVARGGGLRMGLAMGRARMRKVGTSSFFGWVSAAVGGTRAGNRRDAEWSCGYLDVDDYRSLESRLRRCAAEVLGRAPIRSCPRRRPCRSRANERRVPIRDRHRVRRCRRATARGVDPADHTGQRAHHRLSTPPR